MACGGVDNLYLEEESVSSRYTAGTNNENTNPTYLEIPYLSVTFFQVACVKVL